ncbi:hypothetical protein NXV81_13640 [Bacteroides ovatus]|nr:hypothetical protein [Bacteroides ovatus]MCS2815341.1 hypothetical protein [Bacteroides ovatus]
MEDKDLEKPEAAEETAVQPENGRALKEEPEKEKKVLTPEEMEKRRKFIVIPTLCWSSWESCTEYLPPPARKTRRKPPEIQDSM